SAVLWNQQYDKTVCNQEGEFCSKSGVDCCAGLSCRKYNLMGYGVCAAQTCSEEGTFCSLSDSDCCSGLKCKRRGHGYGECSK
nr:Chain A, Xt3a [Xibalbanus tulumensis]